MTGKCVLSAVLFFVIKKGITDRPSHYLSFQCFCIQQKDHSCDSHYSRFRASGPVRSRTNKHITPPHQKWR